MSVLEVVAGVLLALVVLLQLASAVGVLTMRDAYQRLHFIALPCTLGVTFLTVAVVLHETEAVTWVKTALVAVLLSLMNGVLTHATARAAFISANGPEELGLEETE